MKDYYEVIKPGIIYGNAVTMIGGFLLASRAYMAGSGVDIVKLLLTLLGLSLVIASGCVLNNYIDRDIDAKMERTRGRAFVQGRVSARAMFIYAAILGVLGFMALILHANLLTAFIAFVGFVDYVIFYSLWAKRRTVHGTLVGAIAGAVPPVVGYCAVSGRLDAGAVTLFFILVLWQMPHFYAIGVRRLNDYKTARIPILPVVRGLRATRIASLLYIIAFIVAASMLTALGYAGYTYLAVAIFLGFFWLMLTIKSFWASEAQAGPTARRIFLFSLITLMGIFIAMSLPLK